MSARQIYYEGHVQGVGFRYTVHRLATGFEIAGWVRNLGDGRVELVAAGEPAELEAFLRAIRESELSSHIRSEAVHPFAAPPKLRGFEIR